MTRKDYILIADVLRTTWHQVGEGDTRCAIERAMRNLMDALAADNPRFDRDHFLAVVRGERELQSRPKRNKSNGLSPDQQREMLRSWGVPATKSRRPALGKPGCLPPPSGRA